MEFLYQQKKRGAKTNNSWHANRALVGMACGIATSLLFASLIAAVLGFLRLFEPREAF
jgi:hypothetical protein